MTVIYKICSAKEWHDAEHAGAYTGSAVDVRDGFIHFSNAAQVKESVAKHRAGQDGLVILEIDAAALGATLRWEPSRGGALFPHIHGALPVAAVLRSAALPLGADGRHRFPWGLGGP